MLSGTRKEVRAGLRVAIASLEESAAGMDSIVGRRISLAEADALTSLLLALVQEHEAILVNGRIPLRLRLAAPALTKQYAAAQSRWTAAFARIRPTLNAALEASTS